MSQTVERALSILLALGDEERDLSEVAELLGVHKSTALRLLQTLEAKSFVRHDSAHRYRLGRQIFSLSEQALGTLDIRAIAAPHLRLLAEETKQTVHLAAFDGSDVFYIDKFESQQTVRMYSRIGAPAPLYCTGVAKAIVAAQPVQDQERLAARIEFTQHTSRTITSQQAYLEELRRVRREGYAIDDREHEDYIHCVAMPLRNPQGTIEHGFSLSATTLTLSRDELLGLLPRLHEVQEAIESDLNS